MIGRATKESRLLKVMFKETTTTLTNGRTLVNQRAARCCVKATRFCTPETTKHFNMQFEYKVVGRCTGGS